MWGSVDVAQHSSPMVPMVLGACTTAAGATAGLLAPRTVVPVAAFPTRVVSGLALVAGATAAASPSPVAVAGGTVGRLGDAADMEGPLTRPVFACKF